MNILWLRGGGTFHQKAPQRSYYLLKYFPNKHRVTVYNFGCDYFYTGFFKEPKGYLFKKYVSVFEPLQLNFFPMNKNYHLNDFIPSFQSLLIGVLEAFDADIIVGVGFWGGLAGTIIHRITGIPFVYDYVDAYAEEAGTGPLNIHHILERAIARSADFTICVSYYLEEMARAYGAKVTQIIPNGFEPAWLSYRMKQRHTGKPKKKIVFYVGQIGSTKILVQSAVHLSPEVLVVIAGSGIGDKDVKTLAKELGVQKKFLFLGAVPHQKIPDFILSADVCIDSSGVETSLKLVEYGIFGKPVVAFKGPVEKRFAKDKEILVTERNPKSLAEAIMYCLNNEREAKRIGESMQEKIVKSYRWDYLAEKYVTILEEIAQTG